MLNLILLILVPCVVILCGVKLAIDHAYEKMDVTILSIFTTIFCTQKQKNKISFFPPIDTLKANKILIISPIIKHKIQKF